MVGIVPSMVRMVPSMVGVVPSMEGVVNSAAQPYGLPDLVGVLGWALPFSNTNSKQGTRNAVSLGQLPKPAPDLCGTDPYAAPSNPQRLGAGSLTPLRSVGDHSNGARVRAACDVLCHPPQTPVPTPVAGYPHGVRRAPGWVYV